MALVGYARVSSTGQSLNIQVEQLTADGCTKIFAEKQSGRTIGARPALAQALEYVREGDTFIVTRLDRLARSLIDLRQIVDELTRKDVAFRALQQGAIDTTRSDGKLLLNILASFAEFENDIRRERQADGIARAKAAGVYKGRRRIINVEAVQALAQEGVGPTEIAKRLKIGRASVYRLLAGRS